MHDQRLEDQLRSVLRADGDGLPFTITEAEVQRHLTRRRRDRVGRRLSLLAAGVAVLAVGGIVGVGNGWVRLPAVGVPTSPAPSPTGPAVMGLEPIIPGTPGRTERFRLDPTTLEAGQPIPLDLPGEGEYLIGTTRCIGVGSVTLRLGDGSLSHLCRHDGVEERTSWYGIVGTRARGALEVTGSPTIALLIEAPAAGEVPPVVVGPTPAPTPTPTAAATFRPAPDLGGPNDAVIAQLSYDPAARLVVSVARADGTVDPVFDAPWPEGVSSIEGSPRLGPTGYLAVGAGDPDAETGPGVLIYDLADPLRAPHRIEAGSGGFGWGPDGRLAVRGDLELTIVAPAGGYATSSVSIPADVAIGVTMRQDVVWTADGTGFVGYRTEGIVTRPGVLGLDGTWRYDATPSAFAPTGRERMFDARGWTLTMGCDSVPAGTPGSTCALVAIRPGTEELERWADQAVDDYGWADSGDEAWAISSAPYGDDRRTISVLHGPAQRMEPIGTIPDVDLEQTTAILHGLAPDDRRLAIGYGYSDFGSRLTVILDPEDGTSRSVTGTFAGWADQSAAFYDPAGS